MLEWLAGYRNESWMGFLTRDTLEKATRQDTCTHAHHTCTHITHAHTSHQQTKLLLTNGEEWFEEGTRESWNETFRHLCYTVLLFLLLDS